jgi:hypothetical protein
MDFQDSQGDSGVKTSLFNTFRKPGAAVGGDAVSVASTAAGGHQAGSVGPFSRTKVPKMIVERGNDLQLQFMRGCNIAACHGNNPLLRNYLDHVLEHSHFYSRNKSMLLMGRQKVSKQRYRSFNQMVDLISLMVERSRNWLIEQTGSSKAIPFLTVGHDGWDSKDKDMLGVCIHFVDMEKGKRRTIAIGLQQSFSKKSEPTAQHVLKILMRYVSMCCLYLNCCRSLPSISYLTATAYRFKILQDDVFRAVNDTASSAIKTGRHVADGRRAIGGTTCQMHAQELTLKHALGLDTRRAGGQVSDSFPAGKDLRDVCKALASKIMDKKSKGRLVEYEKLSM